MNIHPHLPPTASISPDALEPLDQRLAELVSWINGAMKATDRMDPSHSYAATASRQDDLRKMMHSFADKAADLLFAIAQSGSSYDIPADEYYAIRDKIEEAFSEARCQTRGVPPRLADLWIETAEAARPLS